MSPGHRSDAGPRDWGTLTVRERKRRESLEGSKRGRAFAQGRSEAKLPERVHHSARATLSKFQPI